MKSFIKQLLYSMSFIALLTQCIAADDELGGDLEINLGEAGKFVISQAIKEDFINLVKGLNTALTKWNQHKKGDSSFNLETETGKQNILDDIDNKIFTIQAMEAFKKLGNSPTKKVFNKIYDACGTDKKQKSKYLATLNTLGIIKEAKNINELLPKLLACIQSL